jgi:hypothetical protein
VSLRHLIHPIPEEFMDLVNTGTVNHWDPPSTQLQQLFRYAAGLAVNLLDIINNSSLCHQMLGEKVGVMDKQMGSLCDKLKEIWEDEERKIRSTWQIISCSIIHPLHSSMSLERPTLS